MRSRELSTGVELLQAWFPGRGFDKHRHDTYAIGVTDVGRAGLRLPRRGAVQHARQGRGAAPRRDARRPRRRPRTASAIASSTWRRRASTRPRARSARTARAPLPFVREPVAANQTLAAAIEAAFRTRPGASGGRRSRSSAWPRGSSPPTRRARDARRRAASTRPRSRRARQFLDAETTRVMRSSELEEVTGLTRYELARQFRSAFGTSPYRYSLMRRLDFARARPTAGPTAGRRGARRRLRRPGASLADVPARLRRHPGPLSRARGDSRAGGGSTSRARPGHVAVRRPSANAYVPLGFAVPSDHGAPRAWSMLHTPAPRLAM